MHGALDGRDQSQGTMHGALDGRDQSQGTMHGIVVRKPVFPSMARDCIHASFGLLSHGAVSASDLLARLLTRHVEVQHVYFRLRACALHERIKTGQKHLSNVLCACALQEPVSLKVDSLGKRMKRAALECICAVCRGMGRFSAVQ
jgi:hypothetical protein